MTKQGTRAEVNSFVQGLITEASPLNFPPNASVDEENFELNRDGSRNRRLGMDYETGYTVRTTTTPLDSNPKYNTFVWKSVNGDVDKDFLVVQIGNELRFFNLASDDISTTGYVGITTLSSFAGTDKYSFAAIEGRLVVVSGKEFIYVVTNTGATTFSATTATLKVRDLWGVEEASATTENDISDNPTVLTNKHIYNLQNQSWGIPRKDKTGTLANPITIYSDALGYAPSNSETVWPGLQFQPIAGTADPYERIYPALYQEARGADMSAPKGFFIIDVMKRGTSRMAAYDANATKYAGTLYGTFTPISALVEDQTTGGPTCVAEFAGRVFYGGFGGVVTSGDARSPDLSSFVLFSQLVINNNDIYQCYQEGDPTSRENSDLVDTDGGFIRISGAKKIISIRALESNLVVIATNGVWVISGGADYGFSASNYKVTKVSSFGGLSDSSVISEGGRLFYWAEDGIYAVQKDQFGDLGVESITSSTIQRLYDVIPKDSKEAAYGSYDPYAKKVRWVYKTGTAFTADSVTNELILDLVLGAFYKNKVGNVTGNAVELICPFHSLLYEVDDFHLHSLKYLTLVKNGLNIDFTFSHYKNDDFTDWKAFDGVGIDAKAFLITGATTAGDSAIEKQIPYLVMHFRKTEGGVSVDKTPLYPSSCLVRSMWNWAGSANSNKWSSLFQAYRYRLPYFILDTDTVYDNGFAVVTTKNKIRGRGKAFAFYMETEPLKDCRLLGWNITLNGNAI